MNVLSLFDGMSCGQIALKELGIPVEHYFASEVDKYAINQTQLNFPNTIQLGDVCQVHAKDLPRIDLLIGGSPCQGFSMAGQQLAFDDPRSKLFFEFVRIWKEVKEINPDAKFLLENVRMKAEFEQVITEYMGIQPVTINSSLVSAQNRVRLYWSNIKVREEGLFRELITDIPQPEDRGLFIKDVLDDSVSEKYFLSEKLQKGLNTHFDNLGKKIPVKGGNDKSWSICSTYQNCNNGTTFIKHFSPIVVAMRGRESAVLTPRRTEYGRQIRKQYEAGVVQEKRKNLQQLEPREDGKSNTLTTVQKDNLLVSGIYQLPRGANKGGLHEDKSPTISCSSWQHNNFLVAGTWRTYKEDHGFRPLKGDKFGAVTARARQDGSGQNCVMQVNNKRCQDRVYDSRGKIVPDYRIRRLTPTECARLQTIPDWYKWECSETQQYKILGNGWTVEVIKHIFQFLL